MKCTVFIICCFLFCKKVHAQVFASLHVGVGLSNPIGVAEKETNLVYDNHGIVSHVQQLGFGWQRGRNIFSTHLGLISLGYSTQTTQGFTTTVNYPQPGIGLPINLESRLRINYFDVGIGYGRLLSKRISISSHVHYLIVRNIKSYAGYSFPNPEIDAPIKYKESYLYTYTKGDTQFNDFKNGMAASLLFDYEIMRHLFFSMSYLIGFKEFSPYNSQPDTRPRLHQNFSIGVEYRFKL